MTQIDYATCTSCGLCARVCGGRIIRQTGGRYEIRSYKDWECFTCGNCMAVCPSRSITVEGLSYGMFAPLAKNVMGFDPLYAALLSRRSVRNYKKDPVPKDIVQSVVRAAATAPMGVPPTDVEVLVIDRRADIERLLVDVRKQYRGLLFVMGNPITRGIMRLVQGGAMYHALRSHVVPAARHALEESEKDREYFTYEAPVLMVFHGNRYKVAIEQDCFIASSYASIAALAVGLGSCFSGMTPPIIDRSKKLKASLGIPKGNGVYACLMLGYPAIKIKRAIPRGFKSVVFRSDRGGPEAHE
jgi:nitroreductase/NAD-dependent dihydropyrimidine dehydrogenase PreA subunit